MSPTVLSSRPLSPGFIAPCLPVPAERCKNGPDWVHEIKHDGYRMIVRRTDDREIRRAQRCCAS
jgi:ATP-dependent DNA ligase